MTEHGQAGRLPVLSAREGTMTDDTTSNAVAGPGYELRYFARKHGLTTAQAAQIIRRFGNDRAKLNAAAVQLRRSGQAGEP
jgi:hypothetical protein